MNRPQRLYRQPPTRAATCALTVCAEDVLPEHVLLRLLHEWRVVDDDIEPDIEFALQLASAITASQSLTEANTASREDEEDDACFDLADLTAELGLLEEEDDGSAAEHSDCIEGETTMNDEIETSSANETVGEDADTELQQQPEPADTEASAVPPPPAVELSNDSSDEEQLGSLIADAAMASEGGDQAAPEGLDASDSEPSKSASEIVDATDESTGDESPVTEQATDLDVETTSQLTTDSKMQGLFGPPAAEHAPDADEPTGDEAANETKASAPDEGGAEPLEASSPPSEAAGDGDDNEQAEMQGLAEPIAEAEAAVEEVGEAEILEEDAEAAVATTTQERTEANEVPASDEDAGEATSSDAANAKASEAGIGGEDETIASATLATPSAEAEDLSTQALTTEAPNATSEPETADPTNPTSPSSEEFALTNSTVDRVQDFLGELKHALVEMAQRPASPAINVEPLVQAVQQGFDRSAEQACQTSSALASLTEHMSQFEQTMEAGASKAVDPSAPPQNAPQPAVRVLPMPMPSFVDERSSSQTVVLGAVTLIVLGWSILFWIKTGSPRLALGTLIGANLIACCLLLTRRDRS